MESIHAGIPTISNLPENRYNHNWLASYIGEKFWLLLIIDNKESFIKNKSKIDEHLSISKEELDKKVNNLNAFLNSEIQNFIYWYTYNMLKK